MQARNQNEVILHGDQVEDARNRRALNLDNILTPELKLLCPKRDEIAQPAGNRETVLVSYADRLRSSYKLNEGGFRDGLAMLAETVERGHVIAISCSCRGGEMCHADVVKMAIEKVGAYLRERQPELTEKASKNQTPIEAEIRRNVRTDRAIAEILSYSENDRLLASIDNTDGRSRSEHSSYLNKFSQFAREAYEQGASTRDGILILPTERAFVTQPLSIATQQYAVNRLNKVVVNEERAKDLAPKIVEFGNKIAGTSSDRETKLRVFTSIYESLEGRYDFLPREESIQISESKSDRFERNLESIERLAEELSQLEPRDRLWPPTDRNEEVEHTYSTDESLTNDVDEYVSLEIDHGPEADLAVSGIEYDRIDLREPLVSRLISQTSKDERQRWFNEKFPKIDRDLENGVPVNVILKRFQETVYQTAKHDPSNKHEAVDDLRIATAYIDHQLQHPDTSMRHENERYRNYASMLERASSRNEVINAASAIRLENARVGLKWKNLSPNVRENTPRPLTAKEMQFLFTEMSPRHYTADMTIARLAYSHAGTSRRTTAEALVRGEIAPSPEARKLIDSLESRLDRRLAKDSIAATKHFLESIRTPNEELRYKNVFDHKEIYSKLPPPEKDFVYRRAVRQKEHLEQAESIRQEIKLDIINLLQDKSAINGDELIGRTSRVIERHLNKENLFRERKDDVAILGCEIGEKIGNELRSVEWDHGRVADSRSYSNGIRDNDRYSDKALPLRQSEKERLFEHAHSR